MVEHVPWWGDVDVVTAESVGRSDGEPLRDTRGNLVIRWTWPKARVVVIAEHYDLRYLPWRLHLLTEDWATMRWYAVRRDVAWWWLVAAAWYVRRWACFRFWRTMIRTGLLQVQEGVAYVYPMHEMRRQWRERLRAWWESKEKGA